jgi:hypothetical protein
LAIVAVDILEDGDAGRLDRVLRRIVPEGVVALQGTDQTRALFGNVQSVPAFYLFARSGKRQLALGGAPEDQSKFVIDAQELARLVADGD